MRNPAFWPDGTRRSQDNAFTGHGYVSSTVQEIIKADTAARVGRDAAATKRAKGQALIPVLCLPGSTPKKENA